MNLPGSPAAQKLSPEKIDKLPDLPVTKLTTGSGIYNEDTCRDALQECGNSYFFTVHLFK